MNCCDCLNFKMLKGWQFVKCTKEHLICEKKNEDRIFKFQNNQGILGDMQNFIDRSMIIKTLNPENCCDFIDVKGE